MLLLRGASDPPPLASLCVPQVLRMGCGEPLFIAAKSADGLLPLYDVLHDHAAALGPLAKETAVSRQNHLDGGAGLPLAGGGGGDVVTAAALQDSRDALAPPPSSPGGGWDAGAEAADPSVPSRPIRVAIIGRPNVGESGRGGRQLHSLSSPPHPTHAPCNDATPAAGKSTLLNQIVGYERVLTGPLPGVTRDATEVDVTTADGVALRLVDTAGLLAHRRSGASTPDSSAPSSQLMRAGTLRQVDRADVTILVVDCPANSSGVGPPAQPPPSPAPQGSVSGKGKGGGSAARGVPAPAERTRGGPGRNTRSPEPAPALARSLGGERGGLLSHEQSLLR